MKSIKLAFLYFLLAYIISTIVSYATYYFKLAGIWIVMFALVATIFGYFFYLYLKNTKCDLASSLKETNLLIVFWILVSLLFDGIVYMLIIPLIYDYNPMWIFFTGQTPWVFLDYIMIIIVGYLSRYIYVRRVRK
jgi:hypothetical protein